MNEYEKLANTLGGGALGQLCMINFVDAASCKSMERSTAKCFLRKWATASEGLTTFAEVIGNIRPCKESNSIFLSKNGIPVEGNQGPFYTVIEYKNLRQRIDHSILSRSLANIEDIFDMYQKSQSTQWEVMEKELKNLGKVDIRLSPGKGIKRSDKDIVWLSNVYPNLPLKEKLCYEASGPSDADTACNNLGLIHFQRETQGEAPPMLVALEIDASEVKEIWRPTQIDAGTHGRFRGAYGDLRKQASGWGRAIHLKKLSDKTGNLGAPEGVTLNFRPSKMQMWFLGFSRLSINIADEVTEDKKFVNNIARRRLLSDTASKRKSTIAQRFIDLCQ